MTIHEQLPPPVRRELKEVGWTKGLELAKLAGEFKSRAPKGLSHAFDGDSKSCIRPVWLDPHHLSFAHDPNRGGLQDLRVAS